MSLASYRKKRDFSKTPEPSAARGTRGVGSAPRFVIQKHAASRLHYDFRLEIDGVLKSWALPKPPPFIKAEKRLAVEVEDHPLSYMLFEGVIPAGEYGGGTVMVWDTGTFEARPGGTSLRKQLATGKLHITLAGEKLRGEWHLVRTRGDGKQWLLIRGGSDMKPVSKKKDDTSVLSGKSMAALRGTAIPSSTMKTSVNRAARKSPKTSTATPRLNSQPLSAKSPPNPSVKSGRTTSRLLPFFEPMKARLTSAPPAGEWAYEIKLDGYRALAFVEGDRVDVLSRNNKDLARKFPEVAESLARLKTRGTVLDGEIVAMNSKGVSSFQLLQRREQGEEDAPLFYYVFDLPQHDGEDLRPLPLEVRRARLAKLLRKPVGVVRLSETVGHDGVKLMTQARRLGLEGLIGKRVGSVYETGRRSGAWIKLKTQREQEFVIGGYTEPAGGRQHLGALLTGVYDGGRLVFTGKVGTGFDDTSLRMLHRRFKSIARATCPFANLPETHRGRFGSGLTAAEMKNCHWVKPVLVAQVKFSEWTRDGKLRQPVFLGLREDKEARAVRREEADDGG